MTASSIPETLLDVREAAVRRRSIRTFAAASISVEDIADRETWVATQGGIALGTLLFIAEAHAHQTSPTDGFDAEQGTTLLGLPTHVRVPAIVAIGRGAEEGFAHHRHGLERIVRAACGSARARRVDATPRARILSSS